MTKLNKLNKTAYKIFAGDDWPTYDDYINDIIDDNAIKKELDKLELEAKSITTSFCCFHIL